MKLDSIKNIYFLGIGGIGMSALARYFNLMKYKVSGYDKTRTALTIQLEKEGININYDDKIELIDPQFLAEKESTLIIYTPAIPENNEQYKYIQSQGFRIYKRAQVLGMLTQFKRGIAIAGTHGKTSVTTMTTHLLHQSTIKCSAFLGGISKNYDTNFLFSDTSNFIVVEADEYDRSFHQLHPEMAVITSIDADHLDIYNTHQEVKQSFFDFICKIESNGYLVIKKEIDISPIQKIITDKNIKINTYSIDDASADFYASDIKTIEEYYTFTLHTPNGNIENITLGIPGLINIENAIAASALALRAGISTQELKNGLGIFKGVKRRFDYQLKTDSIIYIDDYAHHPEELKAFISSVKDIYKTKKITGIFQPHLYSRTKDFASEFAKSLSLLDELILLDIYPARELPMPGVTSSIIFDEVTTSKKTLCEKLKVVETINFKDTEILLTMGAGDIDTLIEPITNAIKQKTK
ncbi:MAG: UDP-N-acetylmuramate--L-alanine ligase [Bacteroidales bacterium]|nr:UDP-N-acetylmuramate--L-alanine ligase [Bacteroidales bacterium]